MKSTELTIDNIWQTKKVCFFKLDNLFAIDEAYLQEVVFIQDITYLPRAPNFLLGLISLRGSIVPLLDASSYLKQNKFSYNQALLIEHQGKSLALAIDSVIGLENVEVEMFKDNEQTFYLGKFTYQAQEVLILNLKKYVDTLDIAII